MDPVLDDLALGDTLEEQPRADTGGVDAREFRTAVFFRQLPVEVVP